MRLSATPLVLSLALLVTPALAQSSMGNNNPYSHENQQYSTSNTDHYSNQGTSGNFNSNRQNNGFAGNQNFNRQNEPGLTQDTQRRIRQSLEQNGFHNVQVMPEAFIIRAQAPDGSHIVMQVGPDMVQGVAVNTGSSSNPNNNNEEMNQSGSSQNGHWNSHNGGTGMGGMNNR